MQIKTAVRFLFPPTGMVEIKKTHNNNCWQDCGGLKTFIHCCWDCKMVWPLWKADWEFLKRLNIDLPCDRTILLPCIYPKNENLCSQKILYMNFHSSIIHSMQKVKTIQMSIYLNTLNWHPILWDIIQP
jgi:hypothetical protein